MKKIIDQSGVIHTLPLLVIVAAVGLISYLLISSTAPFKGGLFGILNPRPGSQAATGPIIDMAFPCGFTNPAFCDNFSEGPAPVLGRANDLDFRKWSFTRVSGHNSGDNQIYGWGQIAQTEHCKTTGIKVDAPMDSFFCGHEVPEPEHWMESIDDHNGYVYNGARIRQKFDFTNRTGTVQWGVDAKNSSTHGWWLETWVTDTPTMGPNTQDPNAINSSAPQNGIGFVFSVGCNSSSDTPEFYLHGRALTGVENAWVVRDYNFAENLGTYFPPTVNEVGFNQGCVTNQDDSSNMFQLKLSTTRAEIWASDHGTNVLHRMFAAPINPPLPFSVGYVHFMHVHYNPDKAGGCCGASFFQTYHWHDMGFDGPIHPTPRAYEIPDSLTPTTMGPDQTGNTAGKNIAYRIKPDGSIWDGAKTIPQFTFNNVDLSGADSAELNLSTHNFDRVGDQLFYQFNNGTWRHYDFPKQIKYVPTLNFSPTIDVDLADLKNGTNTLKFKAVNNFGYLESNSILVANIDLEINPPDSQAPAPDSPMISCELMDLMMRVMPGMQMLSDPCTGMVMTPMPSMAGTPVPTSMPISTPTPVPTPCTSNCPFLGQDSNTKGNWKGNYGNDGRWLQADAQNIPDYATVNINNASTYTWAQSTSDIRALQKSSSTTDRLAATWFGGQYTIDVNLTDGQEHKVSLYSVDWDSTSRSQTINLVDTNSGATLDTRSVNNFSNGAYLSWRIRGHVQFRVASNAGANAVVSGIFFDPSNAVTTPTPSPTSTPTPKPTIAPTPAPQGSLITITAGGQSGVFNGTTVRPNMILQVNGSNKQTWNNVGGNGPANQFLTFSYNSPTKVTHDQVRVRFTNDQYNASTGQDVNLYVQKINIDGVNFPSNAPSVFSNGVWTPSTGCAGGNKQSILLSCNGFFQY